MAIEKSVLRGTVAAAAVLAAMPSLAHAEAATDSGSTLGEVIVTAARRETSVQSTPIAVTAVSGTKLQDEGVRSVADLNKIAPTVQFSTSNGTPQIFIRGIGLSQVSLGGEGGVATHIDGVYLGRPVHINSALYDLERVEVLRGPQGTLYGRNATGGSINFITASPTATPQAYAILTVGNFEERRAEAAVSGPITDGVEGRLAFVYDTHDGYTENLVTGRPIGHPETVAGRVSLLLAPQGSPFTLRLTADYLKTTNDPSVFKRRDTYNAPNSVPGGRFTDEPWKIYSTTVPIGDQELSGLNATATWDLGWASLKSITAERQGSVHRSTDVDASDLTTFENLYGYTKASQFSQEFQLLSKDTGRLTWVAGAYYYEEKAKDQNPFHIDLNFATVAKPFIVPFDLGLNSEQYTRAYAVFGQASYAITDQLKATFGLRYSKDEKKISEFASNTFPTLPALTSSQTAHLQAQFSAWTPKFVLEYRLGDTFLYASASRGFKAGGFNSSTPAQTAPYGPEYITTIELGAKRDWLEGHLRTNLAIYTSEYKDLQVTQYINAVSIITNAAKARISGAELEVTYRPVQGLTLDGSFAYLNTEYERTTPPFQLRDGLSGAFVDMSGKALPYAPPFAFNLGAEYRWPVASLNGDLMVNATFEWRDKSHLDVLDFPTETQKAYGVANVRAAYERAGGKLEFALFARNLFNEDYYVTLLRSQPTINGSVGFQNTPRTYGAELRLRY
jgi:iron complex outermembrane receptor protein